MLKRKYKKTTEFIFPVVYRIIYVFYFGICMRVVPPSERVVVGNTPFHFEPTSLIHWSLI